MVRRPAHLAVWVLVLLLAFQAVPAISAFARGASGPPAPPSSSGAPNFRPDYKILGALKGSEIVQSGRPNSAQLVGGFQFATTYYTAQDLQDAYGATSLYAAGFNGRGETIAIIDAYGDPTIYQDLATFDKVFSLPPANLTVIPVGPYDPALGITYGWDAETALDVEAAHAMAPYAHINLLIGANASNALFEAVKMVVDQNLGNVVSMSWGEAESLYAESGFSAAGYLNYPYADYYFQQGSAKGISFFGATGDYGAFDGTPAVTGDFPSSSPFVTAVGGTTLFLTPTSGLVAALNSSASYQGEEAWSVSPQYVGLPGVSSGGGYSSFYPQPYYQAGAIQSNTRTFPDVAADANPYTGLVIVLEGGLYAIGGTSLSSPLWAGMTAVMDQYAGKSLGLLNPYLYSVYGNKSSYASDFHQVTFGFNGEYQAGPGYNLVTGLGSPNLPALAADIKHQARGLTVAVSTGRGKSASAPTQYSYGDTITISATAATPQGSPVSTGNFAAEIRGTSGVVASVPLTYNGTSWTGKYKIAPTDPFNAWTVTVSGTSGTYAGKGIADVDVGGSIVILSPLPYPYGKTVPRNQPFTIAVDASNPDGAPATANNMTARLIFEGKVVSEFPLIPLTGGLYEAEGTVFGDKPQGTYTLVISSPSFGSAYEYFYVGEGITGVMVTPNDEAIPSAAPGQLVTLLASTSTADGKGGFTSNDTAKVYSLGGTLMATVKLAPAPNRVQFGVYNFFNYQQANFTIPQNFTRGFYKIQFLSSYDSNSTTGTQLGNYTTGFYVSGPTVSYTLSEPTSVYEGEYFEVFARITDSGGAPVTSGVFLATAIPTGYAFEALLADYYGYTGIPMQYVPALGEWEAVFQVPSVLTSYNPFTGNTLSLPSGPWTVFVTGESAAASNVVPSSYYLTVLPYTYYPLALLSPSNVMTAPLVAPVGGGYALSSIAAGALTIDGLNITLSGVSVSDLTLVNSTVRLVGSQVGAISASGSTLALLGGTRVAYLSLVSTPLSVQGSTYNEISPSPPTLRVTGLSGEISTTASFTVTVSGDQLANGTLVAQVDGRPVPLSITSILGGLLATGTINAKNMTDGAHTLLLSVNQTDAQMATLSTPFATDAQVASVAGNVSALSDLVYVVVIVAVVALVAAAVAIGRRAPRPPAQV